jgi:hypothetical protein
MTSEEVPEEQPQQLGMPLSITETPETGYFLPGGGYDVNAYPSNVRGYNTPVEFQTGFTLDTIFPEAVIGNVRSYRGQMFQKTPMGWMKQ